MTAIMTADTIVIMAMIAGIGATGATIVVIGGNTASIGATITTAAIMAGTIAAGVTAGANGIADAVLPSAATGSPLGAGARANRDRFAGRPRSPPCMKRPRKIANL